MDKYIKYLDKNNYSKNTIKTYKNILENYVDLLSDMRLVRSKLLDDKYSPNTMWTHYNVLLSYLKFKKDKRTNVLSRIKLSKIPNVYRQVFTKDFLYKKTSDLDNYKNIIVRLLFETGIRANELKSLTLVDQSTIKVVGKGNKTREIFHNFETTKLFKGFEYSYKTLRMWVKEVLGNEYTPHSIRRSHATHMLLRGANPKTVMLQLGHSKVETTYKYLNLSKKENRKQYLKHF
ncbi:integrase/recombinase XerD [Mycoplasma testudineum]|uniref:Integrase/recombinase XerD n=1 Tax=Mycoplasma testudineum TaxID=244584 RepID=A0A4V3C396_9MOLU|nr:site-specific integrase [Mycoplasma testudineum]OYD27026.1 recombinase XerC [Mycoplasma testudineum]TDO21219.1 integrase/recombinase XerD [Mycoplasma testudineum]